MVGGIDSFREWFRDYESNYVIIGGTACDLLMNEAGLDFRATRDLDIVIIVESMNAQFGSRIWEYVREAGYERRFMSSGKPRYYRFVKPKSSKYPAMIEFFSRHVDGIVLPPGTTLTPLPIGDEVPSLSAILLDDVYYDFLRTGVTVSDGISILDAAHLIPLKAKAWLNLRECKAQSSPVDSNDIRKHRNDILRLLGLLSPDTDIVLPDAIAMDMTAFLSDVDEHVNLVRVAAAYNLTDLSP